MTENETTTDTIRADITEAGEGFPADGELIGDWRDSGLHVYCVIRDLGPIRTQQAGRGNVCLCLLREVDIDDEDVARRIDLTVDDMGLRNVGIELDA